MVDEKEICMAGGERGASFGAQTIWVKHEGFVKTMVEHFRLLWQQSIKINEDGRCNDDAFRKIERLLTTFVREADDAISRSATSMSAARSKQEEALPDAPR